MKPLLFDNMQFHLLYDVVYYGLVSLDSLGEEKAQRLLSDVRDETAKKYKGNVEFMVRQTNLERGILNQYLLKPVKKLIANHSTAIQSNNLNKAFEKVDQVKQIAGRTIT